MHRNTTTVDSSDVITHLRPRCRSPNVQLNTLSMMAEGRTELDHDGSLRMRAMSCNASGRAALSAATQAAYIATASVAAPAGMPAAEARSFTHDIRRIPTHGDHNGIQTVGRGWIDQQKRALGRKGRCRDQEPRRSTRCRHGSQIVLGPAQRCYVQGSGHSRQQYVSIRSTDPRHPLAGMRASIRPHCSELSAVSESDMDDWWLATLIVAAFIVALTLLVYLGVEWAAGM